MFDISKADRLWELSVKARSSSHQHGGKEIPSEEPHQGSREAFSIDLEVYEALACSCDGIFVSLGTFGERVLTEWSKGTRAIVALYVEEG